MKNRPASSALQAVLCLLVTFFSATAAGGFPAGFSDSSLFTEQNEILQFSSEGHILGFTSNRVFMAGLGYALIEEFVGSSGVMPVAGRYEDLEPFRDSGTKEAGAPPFRGVTYPGLWQGITLRYVQASDGLAESVYVVKPGADVQDIRIRYSVDFSIGDDGGIRFSNPTKKGYFTMSRPVAWQEVGGHKVPVTVSFRDHGDRTLGFDAGTLNPDYDLVIDPTYQWHTFYGSGSPDQGWGISVTGDGVYVSGDSDSTWNGEGGQTPKHNHNGGGRGIVVVKLNSSGSYQWHTFYGSENSYGRGIAATTEGVYVTGYSVDTWQGDGDTDPIHEHSTNPDIFVLKLNSEGTYQWHTFYGSDGFDYGRGIAATTNGIYVAGDSSASWQEDDDKLPLHPHSGGNRDILVLKLNSEGAYQWHTFYGSENRDYGHGIALTTEGLYVTGRSEASWQGYNNADPNHPHGGDYDIVVLKLSSEGACQWHTFYGSADIDEGNGIAATTDGAYVTGGSKASWQGDGDTGPLHPHGGGYDIVVMKLSSAGAYQWHTFYGCGGADEGRSIALTSEGVYVTGQSYDGWQGDESKDPLNSHSVNNDDIVIMKLFDQKRFSPAPIHLLLLQ